MFERSPILAGTVPEENVNSTLASYEPHNEQQEYAIELAQAFLAAPNDQAAGLLLVGDPGNGKTHLAVGIAREIERRGGRAAFIRFHAGMINLDDIPGAPNHLGWWYALDQLVDSFDVIVIDDIPGNMQPGPRSILQSIILSSYAQGKRMVMTSNQQSENVISQIARPSGQHSDSSIAVRERIEQAWRAIQFSDVSHRSLQAKWWEGTQPAQGSSEVAQRPVDAQLLLVAQALLEIASAGGISGPAIEQIRQLLEER